MIKNEEQFIDFISNSFERIKNIPDSWIGIGDDAASINLNSKNVIFCSDAMVENVHFRKQDGFESVGWKSIVSNQSDLAGMGATPIAFTITLGVNNKFSNEEIKDLYKGMNKACEVHGGYLVGGDVVHSTDIFVSISAIGELFNKDSIMLRDKAKINDLVAVTGEIGNAAAGLFSIENDINLYTKQKNIFLKPSPKISHSENAIKAGIRCGMDISDGLQKDLQRICSASKVSIEIEVEKIPFDKKLKDLYTSNLYEKIITSGEDYQLLIIGSEEKLEKIHKKTEIIIIGKVVDNNSSELIFKNNKNNLKITSESFDHFGK